MTTNTFVARVSAVMLALTFIGLAGLSHAQQPSRATLAMSREILEIKGAKALFDPVVRGVVEQIRRTVLQTNLAVQKDINDVAASLQKEFAPRIKQLIDESVRIYASKFTEQELKELLAFYKSPLGRKAIAEEPKALDESMTFGNDWSEKLAEEVLNRFRAEMKKKGHDI